LVVIVEFQGEFGQGKVVLRPVRRRSYARSLGPRGARGMLSVRAGDHLWVLSRPAATHLNS
jgi:hypothetical protein